MIKSFVLGAAALATSIAVAPAASADPHREILPLHCGDQTLMVSVAPANGTFTPNFDSASTRVFKPTSISVTKQAFTGTTPLGGSETTTSVLGQGKQSQRGDTVTCTMSETLPGPDVGLPADETLLVTAVVQGIFTPRSS